MHRSDTTQAGNATETPDTLTTVQNNMGAQAMYQARMLFMQFKTEWWTTTALKIRNINNV